MRTCLRCGTEMKENCAIKVEGAGYGIVMSSDENKLFGGRIGKPKYAGLYTVGQDNNLNACLFYLSFGFEIGGLDTKIYENTKQSGKYD